jgi:hypothetical protein
MREGMGQVAGVEGTWEGVEGGNKSGKKLRECGGKGESLWKGRKLVTGVTGREIGAEGKGNRDTGRGKGRAAARKGQGWGKGRGREWGRVGGKNKLREMGTGDGQVCE